MSRLARVFAWIGLTSIGGGRAAYIYEALVERRGWLTQEEFLPGLALCQLLPAPTISSLAIFLGHGLRGGLGAALDSWLYSSRGPWRSWRSAPCTFHMGSVPGRTRH